jgi:hypothetical protein
MALLCGHTGRLTAENGGLQPGQCPRAVSAPSLRVNSSRVGRIARHLPHAAGRARHEVCARTFPQLRSPSYENRTWRLCGERDETRLVLVSCRGRKGTRRDGAGRAAAPTVRRSAAPRTTRRRRQTCAARMHVDQVARAGRVGVSMYWSERRCHSAPPPLVST